MSMITCDGTITESSQTYPKCDSGWLIVSDAAGGSTIADLSASDIDLLGAAVIGLFVAAFIGKFLIRMFTTPPGRA